MAHAGDNYVRAHGPTTVVRDGQRYLDSGSFGYEQSCSRKTFRQFLVPVRTSEAITWARPERSC
jgi:hypothetical protein